MEPNKLYIIDEKTLKHLLARDNELTYLECAGVDNWSYYGEGRDDFIREELEELNISLEEDIDFDFEDIADIELKNFKRYYEPEEPKE